MTSEPYGTDPDLPEAVDLNDTAAGQGGEAYRTGRTSETEGSSEHESTSQGYAAGAAGSGYASERGATSSSFANEQGTTGSGYGSEERATGSGLETGQGAGDASTGETDAADTTSDKRVAGGTTRDEQPEPFFSQEHATEMRQKWQEIQAAFVDDPRDALRRADELTGEVHKALSNALEERHQALVQGVSGDDTEELRVALRKYRQMLDQVLAL